MAAHSSTQNYISVASGIGSLDLAVDHGSCGAARPVCYVENEATAAGILAARMADGGLAAAPVWSDLHTFNGKPWRGLVDGLVGGYPCQPFSIAGPKRGLADERNLWPAIERLIDSARPSWCFFENVAGHLRIGYFDSVRPSLERRGFQCAEQIVAASDIGAPHRRERVFILAVVNPCSSPMAGDRQQRSQDQGQCREASRASTGISSRPTFPPAPDDATGWQRADAAGWPAAAAQPEIRRMANGPAGGLDVHRNEQIRMLGNAVVPAQAALAWRLLWTAFRCGSV